MQSVLTNRKGSTLITVIFLCGMMALLAGSLLRYSSSERRGNERNRLGLRAKNAAENVAIYAAEQLTTKLYRLGSAPEMHFDWTGSGSNRIYPPPDSVLTSAFYGPANVEVRAGIQDASDYELVEDETDPNNGLQVSIAKVPIVAKATVTHSALGSLTSYVQQDMEIALTPLFQFGMFYNMDLELYPSVEFKVAGPVHSNKRIMAKPDGSADVPIKFLKRVTSAEGLYADAAIKAATRGQNGAQTTQDMTKGSVIFLHTNGTPTSLKNSSNKWRDHKFTTTTETTTTISNFRTFAMDSYNGNLRTSAHGVTPLELPGVGTYSETNNPSTLEDERNNGRQLVEPPNPQKYNGSTWINTTDDSNTKETKISYKAGLYIMVNPDDSITPRSGTLPDGTTAYVLPHSYRAWLNSTNSSGTRTCTEIVLPGQALYGYNAGTDGTLGTADDFMYANYLPNRFTEQSVGGNGSGNAVLRIPQHGYGMGTGYQLNGARALGDTSLTVDTGTGSIMAGEVVTIGTWKYLVAQNYPGGAGNLMISAPGLRAAAADNATVTVNPYGAFNVPASPIYSIYGNHLQYAHAIDLRLTSSGTGTNIIPGSTITLNGVHKYVVTAAPVTGAPNNTTTTYRIHIAGNTVDYGLRTSLATGNAFAVDPTSFDLGTGVGFRLSAARAAGATSLAVDTGTGTILPGNTLFVGGKRYLVTSALNTSSVTIFPGLEAAAANDEVVMIDPFSKSGYSRSTAYPAANTGMTFPTDSTAPFSAADAYFFDLRRANSNRGVTSYSGTTALYNRFAVPYRPRAIAKIDLDMTRFKMMVNRVMSDATTALVYEVRAPNVTGVTWANSIFNTAATRANLGLGIGSGSTFNTFPTTANTDTSIRPDSFRVYYAPADPETTSSGGLDEVLNDPMSLIVPASEFYNDSAPDAWYDGVAVYIHSVDAEKRAQTSGVPNRVDSGVRLWNGRGPVISLSNGDAAITGFTLVTNDAVYTVGHFNADGTIDSSDTDTGSGSPNFYGGYSAEYPDSSEERLTAIMGDAYTALSQPRWSSNSSGQVSGWNDAMSAYPVTTGSNSDWETGGSATAALNGNDDGLYGASAKPGLLPNQNYSGSPGSATSIKLPAIDTEVSAALLMGIVPSNHDPRDLTDGFVPSSFLSSGTPSKAGNGVNSGGANNFPRLLDNWSGVGLYIRGSIVALYESRVAMEPFTNSRNYRAPGRYWGLHHRFSLPSHDVPLEPIVIGSTRVGFRELTKAEYEFKKAAIEAL